MNDGALTDAEIDELDDFLLNAESLEDAMDIAMLDGFLTAIISGPKTIMPSEWMRWVWDVERGKDGPVFKSTAQAQRIMNLLVRHMNGVVSTLMRSPEDYAPMLSENPNDGAPIPILDEWCMGFMKGVQLDTDGWRTLDVEHPEWISTMVLYGTKEGWKTLEEKALSVEEHGALADGLADSVRNIHRYWLEQRRPAGLASESSRHEPVRAAPQIGRNELCPCGSGKKYKRCHGSAERLH